MGYDLTWADDPYAEERLAVFEAVIKCLPPGADVFRFNAYMSAAYRATETVGGYLRTSNALMHSLVIEMANQHMFAGNEGMRHKLEHQAGILTPDEIDIALNFVIIRNLVPIKPPDVVVTEIDQAMAQATLEAGLGSISGVESMMDMSTTGWVRDWVRWIIFMEDAYHHGGIVVS
jgi:hypothetical protein